MNALTRYVSEILLQTQRPLRADRILPTQDAPCTGQDPGRQRGSENGVVREVTQDGLNVVRSPRLGQDSANPAESIVSVTLAVPFSWDPWLECKLSDDYP